MVDIVETITQLKISSEDILNQMVGYYREAYEDTHSEIIDFVVGSQIRNILESGVLKLFNSGF